MPNDPRGEFNVTNGRFAHTEDDCRWCPWLGALVLLSVTGGILAMLVWS